jgi:L-galactose dehydrogenase
MDYRPLGRTGLRVSALSFGASSLGGAFGPVDEATTIRSVRTALDLGVNFIDVAPFYGLTKAETVLGKALRGVTRDRYFIGTKVGRYGDRDSDFSARRVTAGLDESLARLGLDYVDVVHAHDIEFGDIDQVIHETLPALRSLQQRGKVRFVGVSGLPLAIYRRVLDAAPLDTVITYCHYTLNDTTAASLLPYFEGKAVGVINAAATAMGLLTHAGPPDWHPAPRGLKDACARAAAHCRSRGKSLAELAVQFSVSSETRIATTLVGTADPQQVRANVAAVSRPLDRELLAEVQAILAPVKDVTWPSGRAENNA